MIVPNDSDFLTSYELDHPTFNKIPTFKFYDLPVMGVGPAGKPFIEIDNYIDTSEFPLIYQELLSNRDRLSTYTKGLVVNGVVPKELNNNKKSIDSYLLNQSKYFNYNYGEDIKDLSTLSLVKSYFYKKVGITEAWQGICHMREYTTYFNKNKPSQWLQHAEHFPLLTKFVDSLPFKVLGYSLFFISNGNSKDPVFIHRDIFHKSHHKSNFINILFDQKPRPFFLYDSTTKEKIYLNPKCSMYMFNESDLHGVDSEDEPRFMLRVEGIFEDWFAEKIGLAKHEDYHESFDWSYDKPQTFLKRNGLYIYENTDI